MLPFCLLLSAGAKPNKEFKSPFVFFPECFPETTTSNVNIKLTVNHTTSYYSETQIPHRVFFEWVLAAREACQKMDAPRRRPA